MPQRLAAARRHRHMAGATEPVAHLGHGIRMVVMDALDGLLPFPRQLLPGGADLSLLLLQFGGGGVEPCSELRRRAGDLGTPLLEAPLQSLELGVLPVGVLEQSELLVFGYTERLLQVFDLLAQLHQAGRASDVPAHELALSRRRAGAPVLGIPIHLAHPAFQLLAPGPRLVQGPLQPVGLAVAGDLPLEARDLRPQSMGVLDVMFVLEGGSVGVHNSAATL